MTYGLTGNTNKEFIIDTDDYDKVKDIYWEESNNGYIRGWYKDKTILLHRLVIDAPENIEVDHINRIKTDCRKSNLRLATRKQNSYNREPVGAIGVKGVRFTENNTYEVHFSYDGKDHYLGRFKTLKEAMNARVKAEKQVAGNFTFTDYKLDGE